MMDKEEQAQNEIKCDNLNAEERKNDLLLNERGCAQPEIGEDHKLSGSLKTLFCLKGLTKVSIPFGLIFPELTTAGTP
jgi:hypothetical protein